MKPTTVDPRIQEIAKKFWQPVALFRNYPVDIERVVALSDLPLTIEIIPYLDLSKVIQWINDYNFPAYIDAENKKLHGFLLVRKDQGVIFVNGTDSQEERRFTITRISSLFNGLLSSPE
jgi:hypothetical protein